MGTRDVWNETIKPRTHAERVAAATGIKLHGDNLRLSHKEQVRLRVRQDKQMEATSE